MFHFRLLRTELPEIWEQFMKDRPGELLTSQPDFSP